MTWLLVALWSAAGLGVWGYSIAVDPPRGWRSGRTTDGWGVTLLLYLPMCALFGALVPVALAVAFWLDRRRRA